VQHKVIMRTFARPASGFLRRNHSRMSGDLVGNIEFFQSGDFLRAEFHADGRHGIVEVLRFGSAHNRSNQAGLVQQPRQRDLRRGMPRSRPISSTRSTMRWSASHVFP